MKEKTIIIITLILIFTIGIVTFGIIQMNKKTEKKEETKTEEELESYVCSKAQQKEEFGTLDYYYKFDLKNNTVENSKQEIIFTFNNKEEYTNLNIEDSFDKSKADLIENNEEELTKTFIWYTLIPITEDFSKDNYIKTVETYGYKCELEK
jgi:preprotein translocase subunit SecF